MSTKARKITGWILTGLLGALLVMSAFMKLMGGEEAMKSAMALGLSAGAFKFIGVVELLSFILFAIPRTGLLGTLLLAAYFGGAIATHLEHAQPIFMPIIVQCVLWITAVIRFPELSRRLMGDTTNTPVTA